MEGGRQKRASDSQEARMRATERGGGIQIVAEFSEREIYAVRFREQWFNDAERILFGRYGGVR